MAVDLCHTASQNGWEGTSRGHLVQLCSSRDPKYWSALGVQRKPHVLQFVPTASGPGSGHHWAELSALFSLYPPSRCSWTLMRFPKHSLLHVKEPQLSQPSLTGVVLEALHHFHSPSLDSLQYAQVPLVLGSPEQDPTVPVSNAA